MKSYSLIAGASALLVVLGAFMPWVKLGFLSANGTDGDGVITLLLGVVAGVLVLVAAQSQGRLVSFGIGGAGVVIVAVAAYDIITINDALNDSDNIFASSATVGEGLYVTALGGVGLVVGSFMTVKAGSVPNRSAADDADMVP